MKHLRSLMKKVRRGEGGFTLIELLVVVAILGAIAAVVVLNVGGFIGRGETEALETDKHNAQTAVIALMADAGATSVGGTLTNVKTVAEQTLVTAGNHTLNEYTLGDFKQAYNITSDGKVTGALV